MKTAKEKLHNYMNVSMFVENRMKRIAWDSSGSTKISKISIELGHQGEGRPTEFSPLAVVL